MLGIVEKDETKWISDTREAVVMLERITRRKRDQLRLLHEENALLMCVDIFLMEFFEILICMAVIVHCRARGDYQKSFTYVGTYHFTHTVQ
jgi:hypothetical protein